MEVEVKKSAFPTGNVLDSGMTLMDYFAGQVLSGFSSQYDIASMTDEQRSRMAASAYGIAEAMIEERILW